MTRTALLAALLFAAHGAAHGTAPDARNWNFRVLLDGREIGRHVFELRTLGDEQELRSEARFSVDVLFFNAYRYAHDATERWRGGCLRSLVSKTDTNGTLEAVKAAPHEGRLVVEKAAGREVHEGCVKSFAYWDPAMLRASRLLNSQSGDLLPVTVTQEGDETIEVRGRPVLAQRHRLVAPNLRIDLWYAAGQWVALESPAAGGRRLRYQLL